MLAAGRRCHVCVGDRCGHDLARFRGMWRGVTAGGSSGLTVVVTAGGFFGVTALVLDVTAFVLIVNTFAVGFGTVLTCGGCVTSGPAPTYSRRHIRFWKHTPGQGHWRRNHPGDHGGAVPQDRPDPQAHHRAVRRHAGRRTQHDRRGILTLQCDTGVRLHPRRVQLRRRYLSGWASARA
jgi:hypothetical protein